MNARHGPTRRAPARGETPAARANELPADDVPPGGTAVRGAEPGGTKSMPGTPDARVGRPIEAARQRALLGALYGPADGGRDAVALAAAGCAESGERALRGLAAYRGNAAALAERTLGAAHPTLAALVGPEGLAALARGLWRAAPR